MILVDTCFLIDYQREARAKQEGPLLAFLQAHQDERLQISTVAWGEFLAGFENENDPFVWFARDRLDLLPLNSEVAFVYRQIYRTLKAVGRLIGANDMWIASHAIFLEIPLLTRNDSDFQRVPELQLLNY